MDQRQVCNVIIQKMKMLVSQYENNLAMDPNTMLRLIEGEIKAAQLILESSNTGGRQQLNG